MSVQRASAPVRLARLTAAVLMIALSVIVVVRLAGRRGGPRPAAVAPPPADRVVDVKERVRHQEFHDGRPVADIRGASFFRGPDGRNHLEGSVEIVQLRSGGRDRLAAHGRRGRVRHRDSLRFTVSGPGPRRGGRRRPRRGDFRLRQDGRPFRNDGGGRFASEARAGERPEISYGKTRTRSGWAVVSGSRSGRRTGPESAAWPFQGDALHLRTPRATRPGGGAGRARRRRVQGRGGGRLVRHFSGRDRPSNRPSSRARPRSFSAGRRRRAGPAARSAPNGSTSAFAGGPSGPLSIETSGGSSLSMRSAADRAETVHAPRRSLLTFDRGSGRATWSASGGIRAGITAADGPGRTLEGDAAAFDAAGVLGVTGGSGRPAVADSADARIEAPSISVATATGELSATGGVAAVLRAGEGRRPVGFFTAREDVSVSSERLVLRPETSAIGLLRERPGAPGDGHPPGRGDRARRRHGPDERPGRRRAHVDRGRRTAGPAPGRSSSGARIWPTSPIRGP